MTRSAFQFNGDFRNLRRARCQGGEPAAGTSGYPVSKVELPIDSQERPRTIISVSEFNFFCIRGVLCERHRRKWSPIWFKRVWGCSRTKSRMFFWHNFGRVWAKVTVLYCVSLSANGLLAVALLRFYQLQDISISHCSIRSLATLKRQNKLALRLKLVTNQSSSISTTIIVWRKVKPQLQGKPFFSLSAFLDGTLVMISLRFGA